MLIQNSIDEEDKFQDLNMLITDMHSIVTTINRLTYTGARANYIREVNKHLQAALKVVALEYVEHYNLSPIDH